MSSFACTDEGNLPPSYEAHQLAVSGQDGGDGGPSRRPGMPPAATVMQVAHPEMVPEVVVRQQEALMPNGGRPEPNPNSGAAGREQDSPIPAATSETGSPPRPPRGGDLESQPLVPGAPQEGEEKTDEELVRRMNSLWFLCLGFVTITCALVFSVVLALTIVGGFALKFVFKEVRGPCPASFDNLKGD